MAVHKLHGKATASVSECFREPIDYSKLRMINDYSVLFVWLDELEEEFQHASGIFIARTLHKSKDRWGQVVAVGPKSECIVGEYIFPVETAWPYGSVWNGLEHWMTYDSKIALMSPDKSFTETMNA